MIAIDVSKQQALDIDQKAIQQNNFRANLNRGENVNNNTIMFFIIEEAKKKQQQKKDFSQETVKLLSTCSTILFCFNIIII